MVASDTLLIRHIPHELTSEEKENFLKHFGAVSVKILSSARKKSSAVFARFESHSTAEAALKRLHQAEILGHLLSAEFATGQNVANIALCTGNSDSLQDVEKEKKSRKYYETFLHRLSSWSSEVDFSLPPPVHLTYQYPPPSKTVLCNICKTLASVPKFYTQVLHLMNKMNLPCPFTELFPIEVDLFKDDNIPSNEKDTSIEMEQYIEESEITRENETEEESELESDEETRIKINETILPKRKLPEKKRRKIKKLKLVKPVSTSISATPKSVMRADEVFEKGTDKELQSRKIEMKITQDLSSIQEAEETQKMTCTVVEGFEKLPVVENIQNEQDKTATEEDNGGGTCISEQELSANRISTRDQRILPVFKNYQAGSPSCRLYIKNLARQVQTRDLHFIYRRYLLPEEDEQGTMFDIRLMQEGRMKGQAFVTLQNVNLAQKALKETNGFILKDKPMVVQFARSSKTK